MPFETEQTLQRIGEHLTTSSVCLEKRFEHALRYDWSTLYDTIGACLTNCSLLDQTIGAYLTKRLEHALRSGCDGDMNADPKLPDKTCLTIRLAHALRTDWIIPYKVADVRDVDADPQAPSREGRHREGVVQIARSGRVDRKHSLALQVSSAAQVSV